MTLPTEPSKDELAEPNGYPLNSSESYAREMPMRHIIPLYVGVTVIVGLVGTMISGSNRAFEIVFQFATLFFGIFLLCRFDRRLGEIRDELRKRG